MSKSRQTTLIDALADDIEGMIDRLRALPPIGFAIRPLVHGRSVREFDAAAHNLENVDFLKSAEVVLDPRKQANEAAIYAQIDFFERLYVQGNRGRIDFGVRRAFLSIANKGPGGLSKVTALKRGSGSLNVYYVTLHEAPKDISICVDPQIGKTAIADLALPPADNENYLSKIATATADVKISALNAELTLLLNAEGLYLADEKRAPLSPRMKNKIKAIMDIVIAKTAATTDQIITSKGMLRRKLPVRERS